ncbi:hypothetical protein NL676_037070 [Syzygium grande]|nr:hypothetical protein NL676_037070 [Syzygium grande]
MGVRPGRDEWRRSFRPSRATKKVSGRDASELGLVGSNLGRAVGSADGLPAWAVALSPSLTFKTPQPVIGMGFTSGLATVAAPAAAATLGTTTMRTPFSIVNLEHVRFQSLPLVDPHAREPHDILDTSDWGSHRAVDGVIGRSRNGSQMSSKKGSKTLVHRLRRNRSGSAPLWEKCLID